jgi:hypothetical protein
MLQLLCLAAVPVEYQVDWFCGNLQATQRRYNSVVITLAENEEHLVETLRALPPGVSDNVIRWVTRLRDLGNGRNVDWSDEWIEEDIADARNASFAAFNERDAFDGESGNA